MLSTWLELHAKHPNVSSHKIRRLNVSVYAWMKRYKNEWMSENYRTSESGNIRIDWDRRDLNLLENVEEIIQRLKKYDLAPNHEDDYWRRCRCKCVVKSQNRKLTTVHIDNREKY